ncbi:MAG: substrate-binding domain-containing protein, partial [Raoultibacter sp.]
ALACMTFTTSLGCSDQATQVSTDEPLKIGVSLGVGEAARWPTEQAHMEARAKELGAEIEVRLNKTDEPKTQTQDCIEMIDSGIDVLVLTPRDTGNVKEILDYANSKNVPILNYARAITNEEVDLLVGYDSNRIGQTMGLYLAELVYKGDYIILRGDPADNNAQLQYDGAMRYIDPIKENINIILDAPVPGWSMDEAKKLVLEAVSANNGKVDAIFAPNDKIAGACREALDELGVTTPVVITGMDAELDAVKRVVAGTQSVTVYLDLRELATMAIDQACSLAKGEPVQSNTNFDNGSEKGIEATLITGKLVTKENIDKILIDTNYYTAEEVYGS